MVLCFVPPHAFPHNHFPSSPPNYFWNQLKHHVLRRAFLGTPYCPFLHWPKFLLKYELLDNLHIIVRMKAHENSNLPVPFSVVFPAQFLVHGTCSIKTHQLNEWKWIPSAAYIPFWGKVLRVSAACSQFQPLNAPYYRYYLTSDLIGGEMLHIFLPSTCIYWAHAMR